MHLLIHRYSPLEITSKFSLSVLVAMGSRIVNKFNLRMEFTITVSDILEGCVRGFLRLHHSHKNELDHLSEEN